MRTITARFFGGPYDGRSIEMTDRYSWRCAKPVPVALVGEATDKPIEFGWYSREPRTTGWAVVPFIWRGWDMERLGMTDQKLANQLAHSEPQTEVQHLRWRILTIGGRLDGFDHALVGSSSKPSDPSDVRWDCLCGYAGSPQKVERHWEVMLTEYEAAAPELGTAFRQALARAIEGGYTKESIDDDLYLNDPIYHAVVYEIVRCRTEKTDG